MNFISLNTRSVYVLMTLSLFAISFVMISDAQTAYAIEISSPQNAVSEDDFGDIGILDIKITDDAIHLLYWNSDDNDNLKFTSSVDEGATWSEPVLISNGFDSIFTETISEHIFINDNGDIGVGWEQESEPVLIFFALSTDGGLTFTSEEDIDTLSYSSEFSNSESVIAWSGDGQNIALAISDDETQGVVVSNDFGMSWTDIVLQSSDGPEGIDNQNSASLVVNGMNMYVIWNGQNGDSHIYFSKSNNAGVTWDDSIQISTSAISEDNTRLLVNEDFSKVLISWIGDSQELMQTVSTDGGDTFGSPKILDGSICDNEYDVDNLGDDIIFMCKGISDSKRYVLLSNDFGQTYSTEFTIIDGSDVGIAASDFPENVGNGDNLYSLWEDNSINNFKSKFLSLSQDKGQTFNFESLSGVDDATLENGIFSRQIVSDNTWYWFVQLSPTTIDFVKVITVFPVDHYLGYDTKVKHDDKHDDEKIQVTLVDEFVPDEVNYDVKKLKMLFNPVNKNGEGISNELSHLVGYDIKESKGEPKFDGIKNILVINQFGDLTVDIKKVKILLVPSFKDHDVIPTEPEDLDINHFKCYDAKESKHTPKFETRDVNLSDQFDSLFMEVHKPKLLCSPVDKNSEGIVNDENYVMCYDLKEIKGEPKFQKINVFTNNQFGPEELEAKKQKQLCVPSTIVLSD